MEGELGKGNSYQLYKMIPQWLPNNNDPPYLSLISFCPKMFPKASSQGILLNWQDNGLVLNVQTFARYKVGGCDFKISPAPKKSSSIHHSYAFRQVYLHDLKYLNENCQVFINTADCLVCIKIGHFHVRIVIITKQVLLFIVS